MWQSYLLLLLGFGFCTKAQTNQPFASLTEAPGNFTLLLALGPQQVLVGWTKVSSDRAHRNIKGYKIQAWTENEPNRKIETKVRRNTDSTLVSGLISNTKYFAHVMVFNDHSSGPTSNIITFKTLEGRTGPVQSLEALALGSSGFLVSWQPPLEQNGELTGYKIEYVFNVGTDWERRYEREPYILDPRTTTAKLAGLMTNSKYRIIVTATTNAGEGQPYFIDKETIQRPSVAPDTPNFTYEKVTSDTPGFGALKIQWRPSGSRTGSYFFAKFRKTGESNWETTTYEYNEDFLILRALDLNSAYEIRIGAINNEYTTESQSQFVQFD